MAVNKFILIAILLGFLVSWVPRVLPFVLVKYKGLPDIVVRFLHYLPVSTAFHEKQEECRGYCHRRT